MGPAETEHSIHDGDLASQGNADEDIVLHFEYGQLANRYVHGPAADQILTDEQITGTSTPGNVLWPLADNLGTIRDIAVSDGTTTTIVNHITYAAFGLESSQQNLANLTAEPADHIFGFTGRERDEESDLNFYRARYYDPAVGRFISQDPIGFEAGDGNLYRYVGNGPTNATDPSGLQPPSLVPPQEVMGEYDLGAELRAGVIVLGRPEPNVSNRDEPTRVELQRGESIVADFQPGGPSDIPKNLIGQWKVSVVAGGGHCYIRYENIETGELHTTGRYKNTYGARHDAEGNQIVPPVAVAGIQWDRDRIKELGFKNGALASRSIVVKDPEIYIGKSQFGYHWWGNNCTTHARNAWRYYSGEMHYILGPDLPSELERWILLKNAEDEARRNADSLPPIFGRHLGAP